MRPMLVLWVHASRLILVLLLIFGASGCEKKEKTPKLLLDLTCGSSPRQVQVDVDPTNGANPEVVYVCEDDTVFWNANLHTFLVEFTDDSPFKDNDKQFHNAKPRSQKVKHHDKHKYKLYEYRITVDGVRHDPQVLGGGKP